MFRSDTLPFYIRDTTDIPAEVCYRFSFFSASMGLSPFSFWMEYSMVMKITANTLPTAIPTAAHGREKGSSTVSVVVFQIRYVMPKEMGSP